MSYADFLKGCQRLFKNEESKLCTKICALLTLIWASITDGSKKGLAESANPFLSFGGAEGDRTPDLMTASHALSQLSYSPVVSVLSKQ